MATELVDGLWHINCQSRDKPNSYLVIDTNVTLVDAGWPTHADTIRHGVQEAGYEIADIDRVLVTHYDADHVGSLGHLTPELQAPIYIHHSEVPYLTGEALPPWTGRMGIEIFHRLYYRRLTLPDLPIKPVTDLDNIDLFQVHHTPGHTPGHVTYFHSSFRAAFIGDLAWMKRGSLRPSDRITSYDRSKVFESIARLVERLPRIRYLCPGHGRPVRDGTTRLASLLCN